MHRNGQNDNEKNLKVHNPHCEGSERGVCMHCCDNRKLELVKISLSH